MHSIGLLIGYLNGAEGGNMKGSEIIMGGGGVQLISFMLSPFGRKVEIALRAKGIEYEVVVEKDLQHKSELVLKANPVYKKIPVLLHNGRSICESKLTGVYIDETWPSANQLFLRGSDTYDRYLVRFWADFLDHKIRAIGVMCADHKSEAELEMTREEYREMWATVESGMGELESRGLVVHMTRDGSINYADVVLGSWIPWFGPLETCGGLSFPSTEICPALHRWIQALLHNSFITSTFPDKSEMMDYALKRFHIQHHST